MSRGDRASTRRPLPDVRPDLAGLAPYVSPQRPARYRMNTNESPYPPPAAVVDEVVFQMRETPLNRYPDRDASQLLSAVARYTRWPAEGVWLANGSNEVFMHLFLAFGGPGRTSMTFEPTYSLHTQIPLVTGTRAIAVPRADDLTIDLDAAADAIRTHDPDVVLVCSPNNPSGGCEPLDVVRALAEEATGLVVVDEAYGEFAPASATVRPLMEDHRNVVLVKTFSKAWRLAGVRLGYMLADPHVVDGLLRVRLPYHLSAITQTFGCAAIAHADETLAAVEAIRAERDRIAVELNALGVKTFRSQANFVLFEVDDADRVWAGLLRRGVLIRNYSGYEGLRGCLRVTAGLPPETDAFIRALREVLDE